MPKTVVDVLPEKSGASPKDSPRSMSPNDEQRQEMSIPSDSQKRYNFCRAIFSFFPGTSAKGVWSHHGQATG